MAMTQWIVFDQDTAEALVGRFGRGGVEIQDGDALSAALNLQKNSVVVLPSKTPGKVLVAGIRFTNAMAGDDEQAPVYEASGFLGLSDMPVFARRPPSAELPKKKWWQRKSA